MSQGTTSPPAMKYSPIHTHTNSLPLLSLSMKFFLTILHLYLLLQSLPIIACSATLHCNLWCHSFPLPSLPALYPWYLTQFKYLLIMTWKNQWNTTNLVSFSTTPTATISPKHFKFCFQVGMLTAKLFIHTTLCKEFCLLIISSQVCTQFELNIPNDVF